MVTVPFCVPLSGFLYWSQTPSMSQSEREASRRDQWQTEVNCETHTGFLEIAVMAMHVKTHHRNTLQAHLIGAKKKNRVETVDLPHRGQRSFQLSFEIWCYFHKMQSQEIWSQILAIYRDRWVGGRDGVWIKEKHRWACVGLVGGFALCFPTRRRWYVTLLLKFPACAPRDSALGRVWAELPCLCLHSYQS